MLNEKQVTGWLTISGQPTAQELSGARAAGFNSVINLRTPDEDGVVADEERLVLGSGARYAAIPVSPQTLDDNAVQRFSDALSSENALPAVVHCKGGGRAGVLTLLHLAIHHGWTVQQALEEGEPLGIAPARDSPYRGFFESFIERHSSGARGEDARAG